jgi:hypothetical protein
MQTAEYKIYQLASLDMPSIEGLNTLLMLVLADIVLRYTRQAIKPFLKEV